MSNVLPLVIALPLVGAAVLLVGGRRTDSWGPYLATLLPIASFVCALILFVHNLGQSADARSQSVHLWTWIDTGRLHVGADLLYDQLSSLFLLLITGVGSLIHVYSLGYMAHDERKRRFFGYLNLFVAAMLTLVLAANYLVLFLGWVESVALWVLRPVIGSFYVPGMGLLFGVAIIVGIGAVLSKPRVREALAFVELPFTRLPVVKSIYSSLKSFSDYFAPGSKGGGQQVVVLRFRLFAAGSGHFCALNRIRPCECACEMNALSL